MGMPPEQIKMKMEREDMNPALLDTPDAPISVVDNPGSAPPAAAAAAVATPAAPAEAPPAESQAMVAVLAIKDDPEFKTYFRMLFAGIPPGGIKQKMEMDGIDPALLDNPDAPSPNQPE
jgi:WASH complex subunit CCDC53